MKKRNRMMLGILLVVLSLSGAPKGETTWRRH